MGDPINRVNLLYTINCVFRKVPDSDYGKSRTVISVSRGQ